MSTVPTLIPKMTIGRNFIPALIVQKTNIKCSNQSKITFSDMITKYGITLID